MNKPEIAQADKANLSASKTAQAEAKLTNEQIAELRSQYGVTSKGRGIREFTQVADFVRAAVALAITSESATEVKGVEDAATELAKFTNDASREAAIAEALAARHATLTPEQMDELAGKHGEWLGDGGIVFDREMFYGLIADVRALAGRQTAPPQSADDQTHER